MVGCISLPDMDCSSCTYLEQIRLLYCICQSVLSNLLMCTVLDSSSVLCMLTLYNSRSSLFRHLADQASFVQSATGQSAQKTSSQMDGNYSKQTCLSLRLQLSRKDQEHKNR